MCNGKIILSLLLPVAHPEPTLGRTWKKATDMVIELKAASNQAGIDCQPGTCLLGSHPTFQVTIGTNLNSTDVQAGRSQRLVIRP